MAWFPQTSFKNGEVSPHLDGLSNPEGYDVSCRKLEGAIVSSSGTVRKRTGSVFVGDTKFSTSHVTSDVFTSLECRLIPFKSGADTYVLVFEVLKDDNNVKWPCIRAVVNNILSTSIGEASSLGPWVNHSSSNLPFRSPTGNDDAKYFHPPGVKTDGTNAHTRLFGLHSFTEEQLPDVQYFQHEDVLTLIHPDAFPMQVYVEGSLLNTRPFNCEGRSPKIDIRGERMSMSVTSTSSDATFTLETTANWFDQNDLQGIYRIGHWAKKSDSFSVQEKHSPTYGTKSNYGAGFFVRIVDVESPTKATCIRASKQNDGDSGINTYVTDPYDWDGPWIKDSDTTIAYTYSAQTASEVTTLTSLAFSGITAHQVVGCILSGDDGAGKEFLTTIAGSNTTDGDVAGTPILYAHPINGTFTNSGTQSAMPLYRLKDKEEKLIPSISVVKEGRTWTSTTGFETIVPGSKVFLHFGNVPPADLDQHVPTGHETAWDTVHRGNVAAPATASNRLDVGGVVHVNGGSFALSTRDENCFVAYCIKSPSNTSITSKYSMGWSQGVGFPSAGASHQGRVVLSGFKNVAQVVVGSNVDEPERFDLGGLSSSGFHFIVNDLRGSRVRWLKSADDLIIGTDSGEFSVKGSPLSSLSVGVDRESAYGSATIRPIMVGAYLFYVQKDRKTLRAMRYIDERQRYLSGDISSDHSHFFKDVTIEDMLVWEGENDPVVILRLSDGETLALRVNEMEGFFAWSRMKLPTTTSICPSRNYSPGANGSTTSGDDFYYAVDAGDFYQLHRYDKDIYVDEAVTMASTSTTALTFPADSATTTTKIEHLDGQLVSVVLDGVYRGEFTVAAGAPSTVDISSLSLSSAPTTAIVGKKIDMKLQPRVPETGMSQRSTSTLGRVKNYSSVIVNLNDSKAVKVNGYEADGSNFSTAPSTAASHSTLQGWYEVPVTGLYGVQPLLEVSSDRPYPVEVAGITIDLSVEG